MVIADVMGEDDGSSFVRPLKEEIAQVGEALPAFAKQGISLLPALALRRWRRTSVTPYARAATASSPTRPGPTALAAGRVGWRHRDGGQVAGCEATC